MPSGATESELEKIIGHRVRDGHPEFEVTWKDDSQSTWLAPEDLDNARTPLKEYCDRNGLVLRPTKSQEKKIVKRAALRTRKRKAADCKPPSRRTRRKSA